MLPPVGIEPRTSVFQVVHAPVWANSLFVCKSKTLKSLNSLALLILTESFKSVINWYVNKRQFKSRIFHRGRQLEMGAPTYDFVIFCRKLCENDIWATRGAFPLCPPPIRQRKHPLSSTCQASSERSMLNLDTQAREDTNVDVRYFSGETSWFQGGRRWHVRPGLLRPDKLHDVCVGAESARLRRDPSHPVRYSRVGALPHRLHEGQQVSHHMWARGLHSLCGRYVECITAWTVTHSLPGNKHRGFIPVNKANSLPCFNFW